MSHEEGKVLVPIINFDSSKNLIQLDETLSIRRINQDELKLINEKVLDYFSVLKHELLITKFVVEKKITNAESLNGFMEFTRWQQDSPNIQKIALTLRLLGITNFGLPTAIFISPSSFYLNNPALNADLSSTFETKVYLSDQVINDFIQLWQRVKAVEKEKQYLEFALSQFNKSFIEDSIEAILLDYVTGFESIVFHNEKRAPNPYGLAIGIAIGMLIARDEKERVEIKKILNEAYELRNTVVHGHLRKEELTVNDESVLFFYGKVQSYLKRALRKLLEE